MSFDNYLNNSFLLYIFSITVCILITRFKFYCNDIYFEYVRIDVSFLVDISFVHKCLPAV